MQARLVVAAAVILLTALTYFIFPGHTYLQQDTQIYLPMLQRLEDPSLFRHDLLASHPHMAWTMYDEVAVFIRRATGADYSRVLTGQQLVFRGTGILGLFLIGTSLGFSRRLSLFVAAICSLGATIVGPSVLTVEYEPVPRGFALPLILFALGLLLHHRISASAVAAGVAVLYHAPTTAPFWIVFAVVLWRRRMWKPALIAAASVVILFIFSRLQPGMEHRPPLLAVISPAVQQLQRMRAAYNWVSLWPRPVMIHHAVLFVIAIIAMWRLRERLSETHRIVFGGLAGYALISVPISFVTIEWMHWSAMAQFQPARAVLFITAIAIVLSACAAIHASLARRYQEAFAWMLVPFIIPVHRLVVPDPQYTLAEAALILALAAAAAASLAVHAMSPRRAAAALAMVALGAFFAIPLLGGVRNYPALWTTEIKDLAQWARESTERDAVFHFHNIGKDLSAGLFRSQAERAVYVEWKMGGQVNYFEDMALEWWKRWQETVLNSPSDDALAARGIDYLVLPLGESRPRDHLYSNAKYVVYRIR
jgi:hypothetical protein